MSIREEIRAELEQRLDALGRRAGAIRRDRRHEEQELDRDWAEQAIQRENDEVLDALDAGARSELDAIRSALARMDGDGFGVCSGCGEEIPDARLRAVPTTDRCQACAA